VTLVSADPLSDNLLFLPGAKRIKEVDPARLDLTGFDLLLLVDGDKFSRYSRAKETSLPPQLLTVNIDHHISNQGSADLSYLVPTAAATTEILYDLFKRWKVKITPAIADGLLTGIYTDTLGFTTPATTGASLTKAGDLIGKGGDRAKIVGNFFHHWSPKSLKAWGAIIANCKRRAGISYSSLSYQELRRLGLPEKELSPTRGFAIDSLLLPIRGIKAALLFIEEKPKLIRVTLRSKKGTDVAEVAEKMGGGGHRHAAAFSYPGPLKEAIAKTLRLVW